MRIGLIGASGFLGGHIVQALEAHGHTVRLIGRDTDRLRSRFQGREVLRLPPLSHPQPDGDPEPPEEWRALLTGLDGMVCAAGTMISADLDDAHHRLPATLAAAAHAVGLPRLVHLSALGADATGSTAFLRSKALGDDVILQHRASGWTVLRPSLVYGPGGTSVAILSGLAALPLRLRFGGGIVRPIHADDVAAVTVACLESPIPLPPMIAVVGPEPVNVDGYIDALGRWLGQRPLAGVSLPDWVITTAAATAHLLGTCVISPDSLLMMRHGADADPTLMRNVTGIIPRRLSAGVAPNGASVADRSAAALFWLLPLLTAALSTLWVETGVVSIASSNVGLAMLATGGITGTSAVVLLVGGAIWDVILGMAMLPARWRSRTAQLQIVTILFYTGLATLLTPDVWAHPYGPLLKNIPLLAASLMIAALPRGRR